MIKQPEKFIAEVTVKYSDDAGNRLEQNFVFRPSMNYDDFMQQCDKMYHYCRATYGAAKFDELMKSNEEDTVVIEEVDNVTEVDFKKEKK